jgi:hypothetical protein
MTQTPFPITGIVYGVDGSAVEGVKVIAQDVINGRSTEAVTNSSGEYSLELANMPAGGYTNGHKMLVIAGTNIPKTIGFFMFFLDTTKPSMERNIYLRLQESQTFDETASESMLAISEHDVLANAKRVVVANPGDGEYTKRIAYNSSNMPEYIGEAVPGTPADIKGWRIKRLTYDGTNATKEEWASGNTIMDKIWDSRATYSYA